MKNTLSPAAMNASRKVQSGQWRLLAMVVLLLAEPVWGAIERQTLGGHVPAMVKSLAPVAEVAGTNRLSLSIGLPLRNRAGLDDLIRQIYDRKSTNYHHYLKPAQFAAQFGPTAGDYQAVVDFARAHGLTVTGTYSNRMIVKVAGSVADIQTAFHTKLHSYRHPRENRTFYAPDAEPSLDLAVPVLHISGLDNYLVPHPMNLKQVALGATAGPTPNDGTGPSGSFMGNDFRMAYVPDTSLTGSGQSVALVQFNSGFYQSDIDAYVAAAGLSAVPIQTILLDGYDGGPGIANDEVSLDIEMAISMAPGLSSVMVYEGSSADDILNQIATDNQAQQISASWSYPVDDTTAQIFQQFTAQGQSFFNASGDSDAWVGPIPSPSDNPYITIVGGTTLTMDGAGNAWSSETVWNWGNGIGSGGGTSTVYTIPAWQANVDMTANGGSTTMRNIPDVAMAADKVWVYFGNGNGGAYGGTSCASPLWAAFTALVNQQAAVTGEPAVGFLNPTLYQIGSGPDYNLAFHDITTGDNTSSGSASQYYAAAGYDLCTGWGTPAGQYLINALADPEPLLILPGTGFTAAGGAGGPFTVTSQNLVLTNAGSSPISWSLVNEASWLDVSNVSGTLSAHGTATVAVSLNNVASNLMVGTYSGTVEFTDAFDGAVQDRVITLNVVSPPVITGEPANVTTLDGATATFMVSVTGGTPLYYQWYFNGTNLVDGGGIAGSHTNSLVIVNASSNNVGTYSVVVSNIAKTVTSSGAALAIISSRPVLELQPSNQVVLVGGNVLLSVTAFGSKPLFYGWEFQGTPIYSATNSSLKLGNVQMTDAGTYSVIVSNSLGITTSSNAALMVVATPPCDPTPSGLVSWWPGEGDASDRTGTNNGILGPDVNFVPGRVENGFLLNNTNAFLWMPASPGLNVGKSGGFTLEGWIKLNSNNGLHPIAEWNDGTNSIGVQFWIGQHPWDQGVLCAALMDSNNNNYVQVVSSSGILLSNVFQHVALTYDQAGGYINLYVNGTNVASYNWGSFTPATSYDLWVGKRPENCGGGCWTDGTCLGGVLDEFSLYSRALSTVELAAIYTAAAAGKCPPAIPPYVTTQPTNQTVSVGATASFVVLAGGTSPLYYQWFFNGVNIVCATNDVLTLTNLQLSQSGNYSVIVSNFFGLIYSSNALLTVYSIPAVLPFITTQPTNQSVEIGATTNFTVVAGGTLPLNYQWSLNEVRLSGATNATLMLNSVQTNYAGTYSVTVTNLFGLATSSNATLTVMTTPPCDPAPSGLVGWWPGEGNVNDWAGTNNGIKSSGVGFVSAMVGDGFLLNGNNDFFHIPASPSLNVGQSGGLTLEAWIKPANVNGFHPIAEWNDGTNSIGVQLWIGQTPSDQGVLCTSFMDANNNNYIQVVTPADTLVSNVFQHVAVTYDQTSGIINLFVNGTNVATSNWGSFIPATQYDLWVGIRPENCGGGCWTDGSYFGGILDELSLYNLALSENELAAIYNAGSGGKCLPTIPPYIVAQPTNQIVSVGGVATFAVLANGASPLYYQWMFGGTNLALATNAVLTLNNVLANQAGNYSVLITNIFGATSSVSASLLVLPDHFAWSTIPSPRTVNVPFTVTVQARDVGNIPVSNFVGSVNLTSTNGISVTPSISGGFTHGVWTGSVVIPVAASNVVLKADDGFGHYGLANSINVFDPPSLAASASGQILLMHWPVNPTGFGLETSSSLVPAHWAPVAGPPIQLGQEWLQPVIMSDTNRFYRLRYSSP